MAPLQCQQSLSVSFFGSNMMTNMAFSLWPSWFALLLAMNTIQSWHHFSLSLLLRVLIYSPPVFRTKAIDFFVTDTFISAFKGMA